MEWADTHPWEITRRRRPRRRLEAALVGAALAIVFLILEPPAVESFRLDLAGRVAEAIGLPRGPS